MSMAGASRPDKKVDLLFPLPSHKSQGRNRSSLGDCKKTNEPTNEQPRNQSRRLTLAFGAFPRSRARRPEPPASSWELP